MTRTLVVLLTGILCFLALSRKALAEHSNDDAVHLNNGSIIQGAIVRLSHVDSVTIQTVGGSQLNFSMNEISKVTMSVMQSDMDVVYLKDKSIIHGSIVKFIPNESLMIQIEGGSKYNFSVDEVLKIEIDNSQVPIAPIPTSLKSIVPSRKSPFMAAGLSFVMPGMGQFYNGHLRKGATFAFITIGSIVSLVALDETDNDGGIVTTNLLGPIISLGWLVCWVAGTCDAYHSAGVINARFDWASQLSLSPIATPNRIGVLVSHQF